MPHLVRARSSRLSVFVLAVGLVAVPGCKKKGKGGNNPEQTKEQLEAKIVEAKKSAKANELVVLANKDLDNGRYVSAMKRAQDALATEPKDADAYAVLGAAHWRAGDPVASTEAYRKSIEIDPKNFGGGIGLARNLQAMGQFGEAAKLQDTFIKDDPKQLSPHVVQMWSYYAMGDFDAASKSLDEIFKVMPSDEPSLPLMQSIAAFVRPFVGKGPLMQVKGTTGSSDANASHEIGLKFAGATVAGEFSQVVFLESQNVTVIDNELATKLKLPSLGKFKLPGANEESQIVLIPSIKFGDLSLDAVPAVVQPLDGFAAIGERPGVVLGRYAMQALGGITFDFPKHALTITKDAPAKAPDGAVELPLYFATNNVIHAPVVPIKINGSDHSFYAYFGGFGPASLTIVRKQYLKSGALPRAVANPEDAEYGRKMVLVNSLDVGGNVITGLGGLVLVNEPPEANLAGLLVATQFEIGGYLNLALLANWKVTYALAQGKIFVDTDG